jgi:O-methyltransferase involved in polyketide biosynthesis
MWQYLGHRHLLIEAQLRRLDPDLIVELGAGLSRRGVTWAVDHGVRYIEVDLPHMVDAKRARLMSGPAPVQAVVGDRLSLTSRNILEPAFAGELRALVAGARRPVVITEGVLMYFAWKDRVQLLDSIVAGLREAGGGHYMTDLQTRDREHEAGAAPDLLRRGIKFVTGGRGVSPGWDDWTHVEHFFRDRGFDDIKPLLAEDFVVDDRRLAKMRSPGYLAWGSVQGGEPKPPASD